MTLPPRFTHPPSPQPPSYDGPLISLIPLISATSSEGSPHFLLPPLSPFPPLLLLLLLRLLRLAPSLLVLLIVALTATDATVARVALIVVLSP